MRSPMCSYVAKMSRVQARIQGGASRGHGPPQKPWCGGQHIFWPPPPKRQDTDHKYPEIKHASNALKQFKRLLNKIDKGK